MSELTKIDFSKLLGFDIAADELNEKVDFKNPAVAARLGAKVGRPTITKVERPMLMPDVSGPAAPVMKGLGGRKVLA
jgi:hypothetical protein